MSDEDTTGTEGQDTDASGTAPASTEAGTDTGSGEQAS